MPGIKPRLNWREARTLKTEPEVTFYYSISHNQATVYWHNWTGIKQQTPLYLSLKMCVFFVFLMVMETSVSQSHPFSFSTFVLLLEELEPLLRRNLMERLSTSILCLFFLPSCNIYIHPTCAEFTTRSVQGTCVPASEAGWHSVWLADRCTDRCSSHKKYLIV